MFIKIYKFFLIFLILFAFNADAALVDSGTVIKINEQSKKFSQSAGFVQSSDSTLLLTQIISIVIKTFLSVLGIIFIILMLWAGYNWMTAGGEEQKVSKAKTMIYRAIIGLIIITASYAITYFVFNALDETGAVGGSRPSEDAGP